MPPSPRSRSGAPLDASRPDAAARATADPAEPELREGVDDLSFREAQVALELVLSQLQASDLDVEAMVELHRRGQAYAERCETLLSQVEQEVRLWDPDDPDGAASPYQPG
jgi:exodeoxyribonuclease VII small subunit